MFCYGDCYHNNCWYDNTHIINCWYCDICDEAFCMDYMVSWIREFHEFNRRVTSINN